MNAAEVTARAIAFASTMLLFGASLFLLYAPRRSPRLPRTSGAEEWQDLRDAVRRTELICVVVAIVSTMLWLAVHAAVIRGGTFDHTAWGDTLATLVEETLFGRVAAIRLSLLVLLGAVVASRRQARDMGRRTFELVGAALAAAALAAMAWMGHAVSTPEMRGRVLLGADVVHLLAAGAWVRGLLPLALTLERARVGRDLPAEVVSETTDRFSCLGILCVGALLVTGLVNSWFQVERPAALFGTTYGRLLLVKVALFGSMFMLAAFNRLRLMPQIVANPAGTDAASRHQAFRRLAQNAKIELALGLAIIAIVGALGAMVPAAHTSMALPNPPASRAHEH